MSVSPRSVENGCFNSRLLVALLLFALSAGHLCAVTHNPTAQAQNPKQSTDVTMTINVVRGEDKTNVTVEVYAGTHYELLAVGGPPSLTLENIDGVQPQTVLAEKSTPTHSRFPTKGARAKSRHR